MKFSERFKVTEAYNDFKKNYSIKLQKSLYELKQSRTIWYNHPSEYLLKESVTIQKWDVMTLI